MRVFDVRGDRHLVLLHEHDELGERDAAVAAGGHAGLELSFIDPVDDGRMKDAAQTRDFERRKRLLAEFSGGHPRMVILFPPGLNR